MSTDKPNWTPGPWDACEEYLCGSWTVLDSRFRQVPVEIEANARLIAQAPAMYVALMAIMCWWDDVDAGKTHKSVDRLRHRRELATQSRQILAAADGIRR